MITEITLGIENFPPKLPRKMISRHKVNSRDHILENVKRIRTLTIASRQVQLWEYKMLLQSQKENQPYFADTEKTEQQKGKPRYPSNDRHFNCKTM